MIKFYDGTKATPKTKAQEMLLDALHSTLYALYENNIYEEMTDCEKEKVAEHLKKESARIAKRYGWEGFSL